MKLTKLQRAVLFAMFDGHCAYCGCELPERGWHGDHVEPIQRNGGWIRLDKPTSGATHKYVQDGTCRAPENDCIDNMMPACRSCNINKGSAPLEVWRANLERIVDGMRRDHASFRHAERFGLVKQAATKVVFYFEIHGHSVGVGQ